MRWGLIMVKSCVKKRFILIVLFQMLTMTVNAKEVDKFQLGYDNCVKKAGSINNNVVYDCAGETSTAAKTEMNSLYLKLHEVMFQRSSADALKLEQTQKSWVNYRNKHCELMADYVGSPMFAYCPMQLNISRVKELEELLAK